MEVLEIKNPKQKKQIYGVLINWEPVNLPLFLEQTMGINNKKWYIQELIGNTQTLFLVCFKSKKDAIRFSYCANPQRI